MPRYHTPDGWDDAFDAAASDAGDPVYDQAGHVQANGGQPRSDRSRPGVDELLAELAGDEGIADALATFDEAAGAPRFAATFTKLTGHGEFTDTELGMVLDFARYTLEDIGEMAVVDRTRVDDTTWTVTYAITRMGPMAEMMQAPVDGVMAAWQGKMPIAPVGLVAAKGEFLG